MACPDSPHTYLDKDIDGSECERNASFIVWMRDALLAAPVDENRLTLAQSWTRTGQAHRIR
jgi:hypothetical protein